MGYGQLRLRVVFASSLVGVELQRRSGSNPFTQSPPGNCAAISGIATIVLSYNNGSTKTHCTKVQFTACHLRTNICRC